MGIKKLSQQLNQYRRGASRRGYGGRQSTSGGDVGHQKLTYGAYGEYGQKPFLPTQSPLVSLVELWGLHEYAYNTNDPPRCPPHEFIAKKTLSHLSLPQSTNDLYIYEGVFAPQSRPQYPYEHYGSAAQ